MDKLKGVNPDLVKVVELAMGLSAVKFRITEGVRTIERQKELYATGKSRTMKSRHLTGHAVDVVAIIDGQVSWAIPHYIDIAKGFAAASERLGITIRWGGAWCILMEGADPLSALNSYAASCKRAGKKAFIDAVHFELPEG